MRTFCALLQFDGRDYLGLQRQSSGRTVQGEVERVLEQLTGEKRVVHAAGRTDAGVHALAMPLSFEAPGNWRAAALCRAMNALLPDDCWVVRVTEMRHGFHARKCALRRRYRYQIGTDPGCRSPFRQRWEWALGRELDLGALEDAAVALVGEHDFTAFSARGTPQRHHRCTVASAGWTLRERNSGVEFTIAADRFLYRMVRMLVGTMVDIGLGRRPLDDMALLLAETDNSAASPPAPPQGLYFVSAAYPTEWFAEGVG